MRAQSEGRCCSIATDGSVGILTASISRGAGGLFEAVRPLAKAIRSSNVDVRVFSIEDEFGVQDSSQWRGVTLELALRMGPKAFSYAPELSRLIDDSDLKLLHTHGLWMYPSVAALRWSKRWDRPIMISPHGMLDPWAVRNSAWKKRLAGLAFENAHLSRAACIHALCESELDAIRQYGLRNPVAIIPNGIDLPSLDGGEIQSSSHRVRSDNKKTLLFLGRIHPKKGLSNLLKAWARFQRSAGKETAGWRLAIAGWEQGNHQSDLENLVNELGMSDSVSFLGPKFGEEKVGVLSSADAFVLPSFSEGLPMAVLEAWSYRLPVLMTPQCNLPEGFEADAAIEIEPNVDSISDGLVSLMELSDFERCLKGENGRHLVEQRFTWEFVSQQMVAVYQWLVEGGEPPDCVRMD